MDVRVIGREEIRESYERYLEYVGNTLKEAGRDQGRRHSFRSRTLHTRRVLRWAKRLCEGRIDVDTEVLFLAVIFHDIGYVSESLDGHQYVSEKMFREFAGIHHFDSGLVDQVCACISIHSDKEKLECPDNLTIEQILLMEADLLDEEGALAICWDGMACGYEGKSTYEACLERTKSEFALKRGPNPMVTDLAKKYWNDKMEYVEDYIRRLELDLEM